MLKNLRKNQVVVCRRGSKYVLYVFTPSFSDLLYISEEYEALAFGHACYTVHDSHAKPYRMCLNNPTNMILTSSKWNGEHIVMQFVSNGWLVD